MKVWTAIGVLPNKGMQLTKRTEAGRCPSWHIFISRALRSWSAVFGYAWTVIGES